MMFGHGQNHQNQTFKRPYQPNKFEKHFYAKINTTLLLYLYRISISLLGHLHFFLHFFFTFMEKIFKKHPISILHLVTPPSFLFFIPHLFFFVFCFVLLLVARFTDPIEGTDGMGEAASWIIFRTTWQTIFRKSQTIDHFAVFVQPCMHCPFK